MNATPSYEVKFFLNNSKNIFLIYFEIYQTYNTTDNELLYKIICLYCFLYCYNIKENAFTTINEYIISSIKANSKISVSLLFEIFYSMNQINKETNIDWSPKAAFSFPKSPT